MPSQNPETGGIVSARKQTLANTTYHEFAGFSIPQAINDGYVNITALAKVYLEMTGKRRDVRDWLKSDRVQESIRHLSQKLGIPVAQLVTIHKGEPVELQGTWVHPRLSVRFAIWLSDEFGYTVEEWVAEWMIKKHEVVSSDDLLRVHVRQQLKDQDRRYLTDQIMEYLKERGEYSSTSPHRLFAQIHDAMNLVLTGETSKQMYKRTGLKAHQLLRDYFPLDKLNRYSALSVCIGNLIIDGHDPGEAVRLGANVALPRPYQAEPIELADPVQKLQQQVLEKLLPKPLLGKQSD